ncbi:hypothetical protein nbrc107696_45320 [Gordonia spumicola]|uniref:Cupin type-2 domain-containing protein n=1 Tax=Gordonia spumicola TaxID=589161 RepID=A0A7I9V6F4_9ACTN|nr:cupin domain-containing protein [Gordonia spumicola]GEE00794.1 hypothetical protein nbrc107696_12400 [Gordonia spumicola]GEE04086.1 hypothetical protein nbrc107696_45320 [Gordonia spumicola]
MTIRLTRVADGEPFAPVGHHGVSPVRLQGGDGGMSVVLSEYEPGATAASAVQTAETIYVVLEGELTFAGGGVSVTAGPLDSVNVAVGDERSVHNAGAVVARMLVVRPAPSTEGPR